MAKDGKTEKATPKRRQDARKEGQVPRSMELNSALILLCTFWGIKALGPLILNTMHRFTLSTFQNFNSTNVTEQTVPSLFVSILATYVTVVGPIALIACSIGLITGFAQVGFRFTTKPLTPKLNKLNPMTGFKRLFSSRSLVELVKSIVKIIILAAVGYSILSSKFAGLIGLTNMDIQQAMQFLGESTYELGMKIGFALLIMAVFDYAYQRFDHERNLRMSKQEIKEEVKQMEGDPKIKSRMRKKQLQTALRRMMHDVPTADVIITNPIHLAVALKYDPKEMNAPKVVAKGRRLMAERIKEIAEQNGVPIVEDVFLAQSLFRSSEVGEEVPMELYKAVAEILAYIYRLSQRRVG